MSNEFRLFSVHLYLISSNESLILPFSNFYIIDDVFVIIWLKSDLTLYAIQVPIMKTTKFIPAVSFIYILCICMYTILNRHCLFMCTYCVFILPNYYFNICTCISWLRMYVVRTKRCYRKICSNANYIPNKVYTHSIQQRVYILFALVSCFAYICCAAV